MSVVNAGVHRRHVVIPRPPHSGGSGGTTPMVGLPPTYTPRGSVGGGVGEDRATPTPSELSESTGVEVEDVTTSSQIGEIPTHPSATLSSCCRNSWQVIQTQRETLLLLLAVVVGLQVYITFSPLSGTIPRELALFPRWFSFTILKVFIA